VQRELIAGGRVLASERARVGGANPLTDAIDGTVVAIQALVPLREPRRTRRGIGCQHAQDGPEPFIQVIPIDRLVPRDLRLRDDRRRQQMPQLRGAVLDHPHATVGSCRSACRRSAMKGTTSRSVGDSCAAAV